PSAAALPARESLARGICPAVGPSTAGGVRLQLMASTIDNRGHLTPFQYFMHRRLDATLGEYLTALQ
ncbi:MAG: hypothetical protein OEV53_08490, partial [Nitrospira sp.]|nr:hypothetical protein [Nitrospira sp.]MDH5193146.1 hypothetical protein [Nitrospira sp.]